MTDVKRHARRFPWWVAAPAVDCLAWVTGLYTAMLARYEFDLETRHLAGLAPVLVVAVAMQIVAGQVLHLYRGRHAFGSIEEIRVLIRIALLNTAVLLLADMWATDVTVPAGAPVVGGFAAIVLMLGVRLLWRLREDARSRPDARVAARVLVFGAGSAGRRLLQSMLTDPNGRYLPIGVVDDDRGKRRLHPHGVPVLGNQADIPALLERTGATTVVFAVANSNAELVRAIRDITTSAGARFLVVPSVAELLDHEVGVRDLREPDVTDLLGRHQIDTDLDAIAGYLTGKRVLVTGAGGSIGSELCRQIHRFQPAELIMLDRDESALHAVLLTLDPQAQLTDPGLVLASVRDADRMRQIFRTRKPEVVFHSAALKHLSLLQRYPGEAVKSNIWGTLAVLEAAGEVERFVNISTDKAADPVSVLGYTKRVTERLTADQARRSAGTFLSVRFGNVLGSRGSVLTTFAAQIAGGGPITVTHPDVTRYLMTIQEAVQLVIQAAAIGRDGEALVLEMGEPVRIAELAKQMNQLAPKPVEITYSGLRPGEKLSEVLFGAGEVDRRPYHPLISHVGVPPLDPASVLNLDADADPVRLAADLAELCALPTLKRAA
ncbi:nucleoside-diphosphate sugar epimerase/dehydratase [Paractinoplanes ferrugineus]|uniref:dTDP-glucose 4,6-dehydratase n=1 Tax=Paractinoplanes ferrugineus TaxID=113564 RepID=A0A919J2Q9_9ACTN|nr:nucleoside-diphosphate sugar epimerase/dehydratase [Actinoplanes ferrugineus]GIE12890.1 dTDP-glucose 4,6-dehydratase [Actinoplanes ferrugineus]